jgi:hypothetical protein
VVTQARQSILLGPGGFSSPWAWAPPPLNAVACLTRFGATVGLSHRRCSTFGTLGNVS